MINIRFGKIEELKSILNEDWCWRGDKKVQDNYIEEILKKEEDVDALKSKLMSIYGELNYLATKDIDILKKSEEELEALNKEIDEILKNKVQIIWQTGKLYIEDYTKYNAGEHVQVIEFVQRMDLLYAAADVIISRAGAGSISELCIVGKPVIFIPSPNVSEDHQTKNALAITKEDAAIMIKENDLDNFMKTLEALLKNEAKQLLLKENIKKMALPNATSEIVDEIEKIILKFYMLITLATMAI